MIQKYKISFWLVNLLLESELTFKDINERWQDHPENETRDKLYPRSFHRYKINIFETMGVEIKCREYGDYKYYIANKKGLENNQAALWTINTMRALEVVKDAQKSNLVSLEKDPGVGLRWIETVYQALKKGVQLKFKFQQHYQNTCEEMIVSPAFIQLFHHRWYLVGAQVTNELPHETMAREKENGTEGTVRVGDKVYIPRYWSLERMSEVEALESKSKMPAELRKLLVPKTYLKDCYGIMRQWKPIKIRIRAFWPQNAYLRDEPLHHTQRELPGGTKDYSDFEFCCRPTYDLKQALMWNRDKIAVLSPESFKQDMINILKATLYAYETGNFDQVIDE